MIIFFSAHKINNQYKKIYALSIHQYVFMEKQITVYQGKTAASRESLLKKRQQCFFAQIKKSYRFAANKHLIYSHILIKYEHIGIRTYGYGAFV